MFGIWQVDIKFIGRSQLKLVLLVFVNVLYFIGND